MSRAVIFGLDNTSVGDLYARMSRGWTLLGHPSVTSGGKFQALINDDAASAGWLGPGRMAYVTHNRLPPWAGYLEGWKPTLPVQLTFCNAEYGLAMRCPDSQTVLSGTIVEITRQLINLANMQEEMYFRLGDTSGVLDQIDRTETFDMRTIWEQLEALWKKVGVEVIIRPERAADQRLIVNFDMYTTAGATIDYLLHDGVDANMQVLDADLVWPIVNRVTGLGSEKTGSERKKSGPLYDPESIAVWRLRSSYAQFKDAKTQTTLDAFTATYLAQFRNPRLKIKLQLQDVGETFYHARLGNWLPVHAPNLRLPFGRRGWTGWLRLLAMQYDEDSNTIGVTMEAPYGVSVP
jgi:hypothetical protein